METQQTETPTAVQTENTVETLPLSAAADSTGEAVQAVTEVPSSPPEPDPPVEESNLVAVMAVVVAVVGLVVVLKKKLSK
jgi:hypothetical protein